MNISNRIFTYPVLSDEKDDYVNSKFSTEINYSKSGVNTLELKVEYHLECEEIQKLIDLDLAEFVLHVECSSTGYRRIFRSEYSNATCHIPISKVNSKVEILSLIVAKKDIENFYSNDFVDDFAGEKFNFRKATIIAYENLPVFELTKNYEEYNKGDSIFLIYKISSDEKEKMRVHLDAPKIKIGLGGDEHKLYVQLGNKPTFQPLFHSMIIFPALVYLFGELKIGDAIEENRLRDWYQSLELAYSNRGINLEEEITSDKTAIELAQEAMDMPINKAFAQTAFLADNSGDE